MAQIDLKKCKINFNTSGTKSGRVSGRPIDPTLWARAFEGSENFWRDYLTQPITNKNINYISSTTTGKQPDHYLQLMQNMQKDLPKMTASFYKCHMCQTTKQMTTYWGGNICQPCLEKYNNGANMSEQIQTLTVNLNAPNLDVPEGLYMVDPKQIKTTGTIKDPDTYQRLLARLPGDGYIVVNQKLELIQGFQRVKTCVDNKFESIVVRVINTKKHEPIKATAVNIWMLKDLKFSPEFKPCDLNGTCHSMLIESIKKYGVLCPISILADGTIIDGSHRVIASQAANLKTIPCRVITIEDTKKMVWNTCEQPPKFVQPEMSRLADKVHIRNLQDTIRQLQADNVQQLAIINNSENYKADLNNKIKTLEAQGNAQADRARVAEGKYRAVNDILNKREIESALEKGAREMIGKQVLANYSSNQVYDDMDDVDLTNALVELETNARKRCQLTGLPEDKWIIKASEAYPGLLAEAKRRDEYIKCKCDDGILQLEITDPSTLYKSIETSLCVNCVRGEDRRKAKQLANYLEADAKKRKKTLAVQVATMMIVALLTGGSLAGGMKFVHLVTSYLSK